MNRHEINPIQPPTEPWNQSNNDSQANPIQPPTEPWLTEIDANSLIMTPW